MRRRDKTGGKAAKTQRRETLRRRSAPKAARGRNSLAVGKETDLARLTRERDTMTRISTLCVVTNAFALLALSANGANAETPTPKLNVPAPKFTVHPVKPKVNSPNSPMDKTSPIFYSTPGGEAPAGQLAQRAIAAGRNRWDQRPK
jgi:hypothetical protein